MMMNDEFHFAIIEKIIAPDYNRKMLFQGTTFTYYIYSTASFQNSNGSANK